MLSEEQVIKKIISFLEELIRLQYKERNTYNIQHLATIKGHVLGLLIALEHHENYQKILWAKEWEEVDIFREILEKYKGEV